MYNRFSTICTTRDITPYKISKDTNISQTTFSQWKSGRSTPKIDKLEKIADYLNVPIEVIMNKPLDKMMKISDVLEISESTGLTPSDLVGFDLQESDYAGINNCRVYEAHMNSDKRNGIGHTVDYSIDTGIGQIIVEKYTGKKNHNRLVEYAKLFEKLSPEQQESIINLMKSMK